MIKNYNFNISEEEKKQILSLHESRTKRHYLINEQKTPFNDEIEKKYVKQIQSQLKFTGADLDGKLGINTYNAIMDKLTGTTDNTKAADKLAADKLAADKLAADKLAASGGTPDGTKAAADKLAADKLAADKLAADKLAADKLVADKLTDPSDTTY